MSKKLTYEFVKESFEKEGYKLLSKEYINAHIKLEYICPNNHKHSIIWGNWQQGYRCPYCVGQAKLTIDFIKSEFRKEGYTLLSKEYINSYTKLDYICPNNHKHSIIWDSWKRGVRCPYCVGLAKPTIEDVRSYFKEEGYTLLSKKYRNNRIKLKYICPKGHKHSITWGKWEQGQRCPHCAGNAKLTIEFVKSEFEKEGYTLFSKEYVNSRNKLDYKCPKGHLYSITWDAWQQGHRCHYCSGKVKLTYEFVKSEFEKYGYKLLSKRYINSGTKLNYVCPEGHKHSILWSNWQKGHRCPYCSDQIKLTIEFIKSEFEKENYTLLSKKYKNNHTKLDYICPKGHKHNIIWNNWKKGQRCPTCYRLNNFGPNHHSWKGGISFEPYCPIWKDKEYKNDIKARDNYICQNPDCWGTSKTLVLHHIDYDKKNCNPNNLITVCNSCNSRANKDRAWHTSYYQAIMYKKQNIYINKERNYGVT